MTKLRKRISRSALVGLGLIVLGSAASVAAEGPKCGAGNGQPATGEPIKIGAVVSATGPDDFSSSARAASAYFKCVNANGGIGGRPVDYTYLDDGWAPEQSAQVASKLVVDDKVVAMVGNLSIPDCRVNEALYEKEGVVVVAAGGTPRDCFHSANYAAVNQGPRISALQAAEYARRSYKIKSIVCVSADEPNTGEWVCDGVAAWAKANGIESKSILIDLRSPDATSVVLQAASLNYDALVMTLPKGIALQILAAAEEQNLGAKMHFLAATTVYDLSVPKTIGPYWKNRLDVGTELRPLDQSSDDMANWRAVMDHYGQASDPRDTFSQAGYLTARIVTEALSKLDPAKIDRAAVTQAIRGVKGFKTDLLCGPWYFGPGTGHNANHAGTIASLGDGAWISRPDCIESADPEIAPIRDFEKANGLTE